jgi:hypothetical protein
MRKFLIIFIILATLAGGCIESAPESQIPEKPQTAPETPAPPTESPQSPQPQELLLEVAEPQDESVVNTSPIRVVGTTVLNAQVTINDQVISVDEGGNFVAMVELEEGPNVIEISAIDQQDSEANLILNLIYLP